MDQHVQEKPSRNLYSYSTRGYNNCLIIQYKKDLKILYLKYVIWRFTMKILEIYENKNLEISEDKNK